MAEKHIRRFSVWCFVDIELAKQVLHREVAPICQHSGQATAGMSHFGPVDGGEYAQELEHLE